MIRQYSPDFRERTKDVYLKDVTWVLFPEDIFDLKYSRNSYYKCICSVVKYSQEHNRTGYWRRNMSLLKIGVNPWLRYSGKKSKIQRQLGLKVVYE